MPIGTTFANTVWNHFLGATVATPSANVRIALFTASPNFTTGVGGTEVADATYARVQITNNTTNFPAAANRIKSNGVKISFAAFTAASTVVAWGMYDASSVWMLGNTLTAPKNINAGDPIYFDIGDLTLQLD
jgi:hypothetical protein